MLKIITSLLFLTIPSVAYAYLDPGTTMSVFSALAPVIAVIGVVLGFLIKPFVVLYKSIFKKKKAVKPAEEVVPEESA